MDSESASGPGLAEPTDSPDSVDTILGGSDQDESESPQEWLPGGGRRTAILSLGQ